MKIYKYNEKCNCCGANVRKLRKQAKLSQEQVSAKLQCEGIDIPRKAISRIETGARIVTDYELATFAKIFHVPIENLLDNVLLK